MNTRACLRVSSSTWAPQIIEDSWRLKFARNGYGFACIALNCDEISSCRLVRESKLSCSGEEQGAID